MFHCITAKKKSKLMYLCSSSAKLARQVLYVYVQHAGYVRPQLGGKWELQLLAGACVLMPDDAAVVVMIYYYLLGQ